MHFSAFCLGVFVIFPSLFLCHCLSIISNKNQIFNPTVSTSPPCSGPKTRHIVIYVTEIMPWIKISRFSKLNFAKINFAAGQKTLEIHRIKFCGCQKIFIFAGIKFRDLAKKFAKLRNFLHA